MYSWTVHDFRIALNCGRTFCLKCSREMYGFMHCAEYNSVYFSLWLWFDAQQKLVVAYYVVHYYVVHNVQYLPFITVGPTYIYKCLLRTWFVCSKCIVYSSTVCSLHVILCDWDLYETRSTFSWKLLLISDTSLCNSATVYVSMYISGFVYCTDVNGRYDVHCMHV